MFKTNDDLINIEEQCWEQKSSYQHKIENPKVAKEIGNFYNLLYIQSHSIDYEYRSNALIMNQTCVHAQLWFCIICLGLPSLLVPFSKANAIFSWINNFLDY